MKIMSVDIEEFNPERGDCMKTEHTPGPWEYVPLAHNPDAHLVFNHTGKMTIASCGWPAGVAKHTIEANARLIAAAPDLLAALKALMPLWDREDVADTWGREFEKAEAAIAKTKGEQ